MGRDPGFSRKLYCLNCALIVRDGLSGLGLDPSKDVFWAKEICPGV